MAENAEKTSNHREILEGDGVPDFEDIVEDLQSEIILACMEQWRTFKPSNRNKRVIIDLGVKIFDMLVKYKASQSSLEDLRRQIEALKMIGVPLLEAKV